jgi:hypothetical protein
MNNFTQKYTIISLFEEFDDGYEFHRTKWPEHITLSGSMFEVDLEKSDIVKNLSDIAASQDQIKLLASELSTLGPIDKPVQVMLFEDSSQLLELHRSLITLLSGVGANFTISGHINAGYIPHSTVQLSSTLKTNDEVILRSLSLVDMFPRQDGEQRKIIKTMNFRS